MCKKHVVPSLSPCARKMYGQRPSKPHTLIHIRLTCSVRISSLTWPRSDWKRPSSPSMCSRMPSQRWICRCAQQQVCTEHGQQQMHVCLGNAGPTGCFECRCWQSLTECLTDKGTDIALAYNSEVAVGRIRKCFFAIRTTAVPHLCLQGQGLIAPRLAKCSRLPRPLLPPPLTCLSRHTRLSDSA
jgi:hypothetical protein